MKTPNINHNAANGSTAHFPFELPPLPYSYSSLEPCINCRTLHFHHDRHFKTYVDNLNRTLEPCPDFHTWSLERLLTNLNELPQAIRTPVKNNGGGVYNHEFYFNSMAGCKSCINENLLHAINASFSSFENWKSEMKAAAMSQFGSGWAWLVMKEDCQKLEIIKTANQDTCLPLHPLLVIDVWEHAYYLQYQNLRDKYIENWFYTINWNVVNRRYSILL